MTRLMGVILAPVLVSGMVTAAEETGGADCATGLVSTRGCGSCPDGRSGVFDLLEVDGGRPICVHASFAGLGAAAAFALGNGFRAFNAALPKDGQLRSALVLYRSITGWICCSLHFSS